MEAPGKGRLGRVGVSRPERVPQRAGSLAPWEITGKQLTKTRAGGAAGRPRGRACSRSRRGGTQRKRQSAVEDRAGIPSRRGPMAGARPEAKQDVRQIWHGRACSRLDHAAAGLGRSPGPASVGTGLVTQATHRGGSPCRPGEIPPVRGYADQGAIGCKAGWCR